MLILLCLSGPASGEKIKAQIVSYDISVVMGTSDYRLQVSTDMLVSKQSKGDIFELVFSSDAKIKSLKIEDRNRFFDISHETKGKDTLVLKLPVELNQAKEFRIIAEYELNTNFANDSLILFDRGQRWYPLILDQVARFKLSTKVPAGFVVWSAGQLVKEQKSKAYTSFVWESRMPVFKIPLLAYRSEHYRRISRKLDSTQLILLTRSLKDDEGEKILEEAEKIFSYCQRQIGEYYYDHLTMVEIAGLEGSNIGSGLILFGSTLLQQFSQGSYDEGLHFPITAQWFAAGVFFKFSEPGFWFLQIALPHYLRLMYLEETKGEPVYEQQLNAPLSTYREFADTERDVPILAVDFPNTKEKGRVLYAKGPYLLDRVRKKIGHKNWLNLLREIYNTKKGKIVTLADFLEIVSAHDQSKTASDWLRNALSQKGFPQE